MQLSLVLIALGLLAAITAANPGPAAAPGSKITTAVVDCRPVPTRSVTQTVTSSLKYSVTETKTKYKPTKIYVTVTETKYKTKSVKQTVMATRIQERKAKQMVVTTTVIMTKVAKLKKGEAFTIAG